MTPPDPDFTWVTFFEKFADTLVDLEGKQGDLIDAVHDAFRSVNSNAKIEGDVTCPFTVMASFNLHAHLRDKTKTKRQKIANELRRSLQVPINDFSGEFDGVPTITRKWWFFREANDIEPLWQLFRSAKGFADNSNDNERKAAFETSFEAALKIGGIGQSKLTSGLFWIRPNFYVALDSNNLQYIPNHLPHPLASKAARRNLSGAEYLELCAYIRDKLSESAQPEKEVDSIPRLSAEAWLEEQNRKNRARLEERFEQFLGGLTGFDPAILRGELERRTALVTQRPDQDNFRKDLLRAYEGRCAITGYDVEDALQACHIKPHKNRGPSGVQNGLLLRADIHRLFDHGLIRISTRSKPWKVRVTEELKDTPYEVLEGKELCLPKDPNQHPSEKLLRMHWQKARDDSW